MAGNASYWIGDFHLDGLRLDASHAIIDQIGNSTHGLRGHQLTSSGRWRALTALLRVAPGTPLLFMGQEFTVSSPCLFFADHDPEIARLVREGRLNYLQQFPRAAGASEQVPPPDPCPRGSRSCPSLYLTTCLTSSAPLFISTKGLPW
ncbi:MAG: hypothetical protein ACYC6Y_20130 [Thermoguttaceae bacterium]